MKHFTLAFVLMALSMGKSSMPDAVSVFVSWFLTLLGFCIYAYGWGKVESSWYGLPIFAVGLAIFVYGVYRVVRLYFYGF